MIPKEKIAELELEVSPDVQKNASDKTKQLLELEGLNTARVGTFNPQKKILIATTWRSGSSIVGDAINSLKGKKKNKQCLPTEKCLHNLCKYLGKGRSPCLLTVCLQVYIINVMKTLNSVTNNSTDKTVNGSFSFKLETYHSYCFQHLKKRNFT